MSNFKPESDGWTWVFRKGKLQNSKPIDNPFSNELGKIASSFYVSNSNFPDSLDAKGLWKVCQPYGRIVDAFNANKRSKLGTRFGFIRFLGVRQVDDFVKSLSNIWIGNYHLYVAISRFQRTPKSGNNVGINNGRTEQSRPVMSSNVPTNNHVKKSYAWVAQGGRIPKETSMDKALSIHLNESDLVKVEDISKVALVKVKSVDTISNLYRLCRNEGFDDLKIHHVGGLWVWFQFTSEGLPLCAWGSNAYKKVANHYGKFMFFYSDIESCLGMGRVCIATTRQSFISELANVVINKVSYAAQVQEAGSWSIHISDDTRFYDITNNSINLDSDTDVSHPPGFENVDFTNNKDIPTQESPILNVSKYKDDKTSSFSSHIHVGGNFKSDYACEYGASEWQMEKYSSEVETKDFLVSNDDAAVAQRQLEDKQLEERTNTNSLVKEQEKVYLGIKVRADITVTGVLGQEGPEGNVAGRKKWRSKEAKLGNLLKYKAWLTRRL
ncbi:RNA-directed DNA polymerase, eukaryota, reverse transcriptase zinc-binding domain protein [Tanacetum coccineum]